MIRKNSSNEQFPNLQCPTQFLQGFPLLSTCCASATGLQNIELCSTVQIKPNKSGLIKNKSLSSIEIKQKIQLSTNNKKEGLLTKQNSYKKLSIKNLKAKQKNKQHLKSMKNLFQIRQQERYVKCQPSKQTNNGVTQILYHHPSMANPQQNQQVQKKFQKPIKINFLNSMLDKNTFQNSVGLFKDKNQNTKNYRIIYPSFINDKSLLSTNNFQSNSDLEILSPFPTTPKIKNNNFLKHPQLQKCIFISDKSRFKRRIENQAVPIKVSQDNEELSQKTLKKESFYLQSIQLYQNQKNINIVNSAQLQVYDSKELVDLISEKLSQSDLKQTRKQSHNSNNEKIGNEKSLNESLLEKMKFLLSQSQQIEEKNPQQKFKEQKTEKKDFSQLDKKKSIPLLQYFSEKSLSQNKIAHRIFVPKFLGKNKSDKQIVECELPSNNNILMSFKDNGFELNSLTVNSCLQHVQQSKIVEKVEQSAILDFFNPSNKIKLFDKEQENFQSVQLQQA